MDVFGGHVTTLVSIVRLRPRAAGIVCTEEPEEADGVILDQPDKAVPEHGIGSFDHFRTKSLYRTEGKLDILEEGGRGLGGCRREALEEEVVVAGHGGVVEQAGFGGVVGVFEGEVAGTELVIGGT